MADWQTRLQLGDVWDRDESKLTIPQLAEIVAKRLKNMPLPKWLDADLVETRDEIVSNFEDLARDSTANIEDFDGGLEQLYDWADTSLDGEMGKKLCWVDTHSVAVPV